MSSGKRPIGAAKGTQSDTEALCQTRPPPQTPWPPCLPSLDPFNANINALHTSFLVLPWGLRGVWGLGGVLV